MSKTRPIIKSTKRQHTTVSDKVAKTERNELDNKVTWMDSYRDPYEMKDKPISNLVLERLGKDLLSWVQKDESILSIGKFFRAKGIPESTWRRFLTRSDDFALAYEEAKSIVAIRRFEGVTYGKFKPDMIKFNQGQFDTDWRNEQQFQSKLAQETLAPQTQVVVLSDFGTTDIVPKIKQDE